MMRILHTFFFTLLCCFSLLTAQTVWTGSVSSDWFNDANWSAGIPSTGMIVTIPGSPSGGNFPLYSGNPIVDYTVQNAGIITFSGFVYNNGTIINFAGAATINIDGYFVNAGSVLFDNDGALNNNGTFENFGIFDQAASGNFENNSGASLINSGFFQNFGTITNNGAIENHGAFISPTSVQNNGSLENSGSFSSTFGSVFTNAAAGIVDNLAGGEFNLNGNLANDGSIDNAGTFDLQNAGTLDNNQTITNTDEFIVSGHLINNATFNNSGNTLVKNAGTLENLANVQNNGIIETEICGIIIQNSATDIGGTVLNEGLVYELQGTVNVTNGDQGIVFSDISETKPPIAGCKAGVVLQLDETGNAALEASAVDKGSYGSCGAAIASVSVAPNEFTTADLGSQLVTLTVTDENGQVSTCDAVITVVEYVPPVDPVEDPDITFECPPNITVTADPGATSATVNWEEPADPASNCSGGGSGICANRTASNTIQCNSGEIYGFYLKLDDIDRHYTISDGVFTEYDNGTAQFSAHLTNNGNANYQFDLEVSLSGRTTDTPAGSPKENHCNGFDPSDWYYYTSTEGTLTGLAGLAGASISLSRFGPAFQVGNGANATDDSGDFGASGWLEAEIASQPDNGPYLEIEMTSNPNDGDINIMLSGTPEVCTGSGLPCADVPENIPGFTFIGEYNNSKYYISDYADDWNDAKATAEANGGHLVVINDADENNFVWDHINPSSGSVWTGFNNVATPGEFNWVNGDPVDYTNWQSGEPNGASTNYGARLKKSNGKWTDRHVNTHFEYVMEISCSSAGALCSNAPEIPGYNFLGTFNNSNYYESTSKKNWIGAKAKAAEIGGHLVAINNVAENDFIQASINPSSGSVWTGFNNYETPGAFNWENGDAVTYTNWQSGEPNGSYNYEGTRLKKYSGKWTDRNVYNYYYEFVVEIPCGSSEGGGNENTCGNGGDDISGFSFLGEFDNSQYYISNNSSNWVDAKATTEANGGYLVVINNAAENDFLQSSMNPASGSVWTGFNNVATPGEFNWVNSDPVDYINWQAGEPNGANTNNAARMKKSSGEWTDRDVYSYYYEFIMEIPCNTGGGNGEPPVVEQVEGLPNGSDFPLGDTEVSYQVTDGCGNLEICTFIVTVEPTPVELTVNCPADIVIDAQPGAQGANAGWQEPTGSSTCFEPGVLVTRLDEGPDNGAKFPIGTSFVSYALTDSCFTFESCVFGVTVNFVPAILTLESCPSDFTAPEGVVSWSAPSASSDCYTGGVVVEQINGPANGSNLTAGTYPVAYLITDGCGNTQVCYFVITVVNSGAPSIAGQVELLDFLAHKNGRAVRLYWATNTEYKNDRFLIERSDDGISFELLARVRSLTDNYGAFYYTESDEAPYYGNNFYRIKIIYKDGSYHYTPVRKVVFDTDLEEVVLFPNPASQEVYVSLKAYTRRACTIQIFNQLGQRVDFLQIDELTNAPIRFELKDYKNGAYTMYIEMEGTRNIAKTFIVGKL